jgi:hypothetical protein
MILREKFQAILAYDRMSTWHKLKKPFRFSAHVTTPLITWGIYGLPDLDLFNALPVS